MRFDMERCRQGRLLSVHSIRGGGVPTFASHAYGLRIVARRFLDTVCEVDDKEAKRSAATRRRCAHSPAGFV